MRTLRLTFALLFAFTTSLLAQTNEAAVTSNPTVANVYVGTSFSTTPGKIAAFVVQRNGAVETVSGSPFTGPAGELVVSSGFLWGTDGTNIATYTRAANGALHATSTINGLTHNDTLQGSGVGAMTLDRDGSTLYVGEINFQGADNDAYAEFAVAHNGALEFLTNSPISVDFDGLLHFSANNQFAYGDGCFFANWDIFAFHRLTDGTLKVFDPGTTFPPNPNNDILCPSGMAASGKGFLAVEYGIANDGSKQNIITYRITSTGGLEEITNSIIATNSTGFALRFDPTGNFLAVAGNGGAGVFRLNANGTLAPLGHLVEPGIMFRDVHWDAAGHVYAISNSALYVFSLHNNGLSLTGSPHPFPNAGSLAVLPIR
jgi:hypothetical protein